MIKDDKVIERLAGLAKIEKSVLVDALTSADEKTISIPDGVQSFKADELTTYTSNAINEAKPNIQKAAVEVAFKELGRENGFEETVRDGKTFVSSFKAKVLADAKLEPNKIEEKYQSQLREKDELIQKHIKDNETIRNDFEQYKQSSSFDNSVINALGESKILDKSERLVLFKSRYDQRKTGDIVEIIDKSTGQLLKDSLKNPMKLVDVVKDFDKKYVSETGRGGGGSGEEKPVNQSEIKKTLLAKGLKEGSAEYFTEYSKLLNQK